MGSFFLAGFFVGLVCLEGFFCFEEEGETEAFGRGMLPRGESLCLGEAGAGVGSTRGGAFKTGGATCVFPALLNHFVRVDKLTLGSDGAGTDATATAVEGGKLGCDTGVGCMTCGLGR